MTNERIEQIEKLAKACPQVRWCSEYTSALARHANKNVDLDHDCESHPNSECPGAWGRYDGEFMAMVNPPDVLELIQEIRIRELALQNACRQIDYNFPPYTRDESVEFITDARKEMEMINVRI